MAQRKFRPIDRKSGNRDGKLIVIAAEGSKTEKRYFEDLASRYRNPKVNIFVIERDEEGKSAPEKIMNILDDYCNIFDLDESDELWLVCDVDEWNKKGELSRVAAACKQKSYWLAVSNPCFEVWLLLHLKSLDMYTSQELDDLFENKKDGNRTQLDKELVKLIGQHNKSNLNTSFYIDNVVTATERARAIDRIPEDRWPNHLGTRVLPTS